MTTPKRVWSNKKTVWDWKKWVWKVWDEIATYDWTWKKAEWQLTVYGNSWENLSWDDKLEVYDSSSATEIGTVDENQGWGWEWVSIDEAQSDLNPTIWNEWTIKINNMPWVFTMSWSPEWICSVSEIDQANSSIIYVTEAVWDCTFTITDNTDNSNTASCNISVQPDMWMAIIFESSEDQTGNADLEYLDTWETPTWYLPEATCFCKLVWFDGITEPDMNVSFQYLNEWTGERTPTDLYLGLYDSEAEYPYCVMWEISTSFFSWWDDAAQVDVLYTADWDEIYLGTLYINAMPTLIVRSDIQDIELTQNGSTWTWTTPPFWFDWAYIDPETQLNFRYEDWEGNELDFVTATLQANDDPSTMDNFPWLIEVAVDWDAAEQEGITLDDNYAINVVMLRSYDDFNIDTIPCAFPASE